MLWFTVVKTYLNTNRNMIWSRKSSLVPVWYSNSNLIYAALISASSCVHASRSYQIIILWKYPWLASSMTKSSTIYPNNNVPSPTFMTTYQYLSVNTLQSDDTPIPKSRSPTMPNAGLRCHRPMNMTFVRSPQLTWYNNMFITSIYVSQNIINKDKRIHGSTVPHGPVSLIV
jgi:hypothetical protein